MSCERINCCGRKLKSKILKPVKDKDGYHVVKLSKNGLQTHFFVHRLVLECFVGYACGDKQQCCHNNGIPSDNRVCNLRWDTASSNSLDRIKHGTMVSKLKKEEVVLIKKLILHNIKITKICKMFKVTKEAIGDIKKHNTWIHVRD